MIGKCNLCKKEKELQKKCHIIPEFFYRESGLFNEYHNLVILDLKTFLRTGESKVISNKQKTGEFDLYKFCKECDGNIIGLYENYGREFFYSQNLKRGQKLLISDKIEYIECLNADYKKLKLLFLSILWRASISERSFFSEIKLESAMQEEIRKMILERKSKSDFEYPVFFLNTLFDKTIANDYLFQPIKMRVADENGFMFAFGGMIIIFTKGINGLTKPILKYRIQENGTFRTLKVPPGKTWKLIEKWYKK